MKDASLNNSEHLWNTQDIYPNWAWAANLNSLLFTKTLIQPNAIFSRCIQGGEVPGVSGLKALRIIRITRIVPCLSLAGMCGVLMDGMDGMWHFRLVCVFFSGKKWCFCKILMQQDQLTSRKADLLIEWGAFFYLLFDWELVESFSRLLTNNLGCWSTIIGWNLCQIRDGLGDYSNVIWDGVLPSDLFFQDGGIFEREDMVYRHHLGTRLIALDRFLFCFIPHCMAWFDVQCWVFL